MIGRLIALVDVLRERMIDARVRAYIARNGRERGTVYLSAALGLGLHETADSLRRLEE